MKLRFGLLALVAACALALLPTAGLAGQSGGQALQKLVEFSGFGHKTSKAFRIKSKSVQVAYSYNHCPAKGGDLIVALINGRGVSRIVLNVSGTSGKRRVRAYPRPGTYHVAVSSVCRWYVAVYGH